jgi:hypothetical protein
MLLIQLFNVRDSGKSRSRLAATPCCHAVCSFPLDTQTMLFARFLIQPFPAAKNPRMTPWDHIQHNQVAKELPSQTLKTER